MEKSKTKKGLGNRLHVYSFKTCIMDITLDFKNNCPIHKFFLWLRIHLITWEHNCVCTSQLQSLKAEKQQKAALWLNRKFGVCYPGLNQGFATH